MTPIDRQDPEQLAAQSLWLRRLAISLVGGQDADDVVQETLLVALHRPRILGGEGALRAWLSGIARNVVRSGHRQSGRRDRRERDYGEARLSHTPGTDEVVERAARCAELIEAVLGLDEPYRTAVLLAYEERLSAPAIAARTGATPAAVRKRISRGLASLRARLDAENGGEGRAWLAALAGLNPTSAATLPPWTLGLTMTTKWAATAATLLVLAGLGLWNWQHRATQVTTALGLETRTSGVEQLGSEQLDGLTATGKDEQRTTLLTTEPAPRSGATRIAGRVLLTDDRTPVPDATIRAAAGALAGLERAQDQPALALTDAMGRFEIDLESAQAQSLLDGGMWVQQSSVYDIHVDPAQITRAEGRVLEIRTVPLGQILVTVLDAGGNRAPGIGVAYDLDATIGSEAQLWSYQRKWAAGVSNAQGELLMEGIPVGMKVSFGVQGDWNMPASTVITEGTVRADVTLRMRGWAGLTARLRWPDGSPAAGVNATWIGTSNRKGNLGGSRDTSDASGVLVIDDLTSGGGELRIQGGAHHDPIGVRVERGEVTDLGILTVEKLVRVDGRVVTSEGQFLPPELRVCALRSGALFAQSRLQTDLSFSLQVPPGPVVLALSKPITWDPTLPFRGSFLGQVEVLAPQSDIELPLETTFAEVTGHGGLPNAQLEVALFGATPSVSWGIQSLGGGAVDSVAGQNGIFAAQVQPAEARILVRMNNGNTAYSDLVQLKEGVSHDLGALDFSEGILVVKTTDTDGSPAVDSLVKLQDPNHHTIEMRADESGVARKEIAAGPYALRVETPDGASGHWQLLQIENGETTEVELSVTDKAVLRGSLTGAAGPMGGVAIQCQRSKPISNLILSATTDSGGQFAFQPMLPGVYRFHVRSELVGSVELMGGEEKAMNLQVGTPRSSIEIVRDGQPFGWADRLVVSTWGPGDPIWYLGEQVGEGRFEAILPMGPLLFSIDLNGIGNNQHLLALGAASMGGTYRLELPRTGVELHLTGAAAHRPSPAGYLEKLEGIPAVSQWGPEPELYAEDQGLGSGGSRIVRFPFLPPGAEVRLTGLGNAGQRRAETVTVASGGWTRIDWD